MCRILWHTPHFSCLKECYLEKDVVSYCIILYRIVLYCIILYRTVSYRIVLYRIVSYRVVSYCIISYHIISYRIISYHIVSYRIISYHIVSYHIISILKLTTTFAVNTKYALKVHGRQTTVDKKAGSVVKENKPCFYFCLPVNPCCCLSLFT